MSSLAVIIVFVAYFIGSIPTGYIVGRLSGIDIRQHGSGNIGATNVLRVLGKPKGYTVFFFDALKGFVAVRLALALAARNSATTDYSEFFAILAAAICVAGHSFPIWLGFKGGKGVATSAGSIFGIMPVAAILIFLVWVLVFVITGYVSLASILAALALPGAVAILIHFKMTHGTVFLYFSVAMTALVVWRHRSNMARLLAGTEQRFERK
ncbi:MAG: glycerol-3-phosphate 1-O-acyltransferase PlsY [Chthoniobacterales bacterium]